MCGAKASLYYMFVLRMSGTQCSNVLSAAAFSKSIVAVKLVVDFCFVKTLSSKARNCTLKWDL